MIDLSASLEELIQLPDLPCALALNARRRSLDELDRLAPLSFGERGQIAVEFERRALWQYVNCHSFDDWMSHGAEASRATMYAAWRAAKSLEPDIPDLSGIPRQTVQTMVGLSSDVRRETVEQARTMAPAEYEAHIAETFPDQHIEKRRPMKFNTGDSQAAYIENVIRYAIDHKGAVNREQALEYMAHEAFEQWVLEEELGKIMTEEMNGHDKYGPVNIGKGDLAKAADGVPEAFWASPDISKLPN